MLTVGVALFGFLIVAAFVLVFCNRESEKVVMAAVPLAFAACSALALIFVFARQEPISRVFPVSFSFQVADKFPIRIRYRPILIQSHFFFDQILKRDPKALEEQSDEPGVLVYHEFLQKTLIDWIASRHFGHWRMELLMFEGPGTGPEEHFRPLPDAKEEPAKVLSVEELQRIFADNRFASVHIGVGSLALPPGTTLSVETPKQADATGRIGFTNRYCEIKILTSRSMGQAGLGDYSMLLGISRGTPEGYWSQQYIVRIDAEFTPWLVGNPRMGPIKQWATGIVNGLQNAFDEQVIWRKTAETYTLSQHLPPEPPHGR